METRFLSVAKLAALEASFVLKRYYERLTQVESKGIDRNLVTEADKEAEQVIKDILLGTFPDHTMLGEESVKPDADKEYCWIVDPLDGTVNYVHGIPHFAVSIALERHGERLVGVVYHPLAEEWYTAEKGQGAFLNGKRITVTPEPDLGRAILATGFPYRIDEQPIDPRPLLIHLIGKARGIRRFGSAALDLAYVAAGRFGGYWEVTLEPWDCAAGILLVEEAGGSVTDLLGGPFSYDECRILATNGFIHDQLLQRLREIVA